MKKKCSRCDRDLNEIDEINEVIIENFFACFVRTCS